MTHGELIENLGTIAHSGTKAFLEQLAEEKKRGRETDRAVRRRLLLGVHGGEKVTVYSRSCEAGRARLALDQRGRGRLRDRAGGGVCRAGRRSSLHLKEDAKEFAQSATIERIIKRYSNFVPFPIELNGKR